MGIPIWQSAIFFMMIFFIGVGLFPSDRELGMRYSLSRASEQAVQYLSRHFNKVPLDYANTLRYVQSLADAGLTQQSIDILRNLERQRISDPEIYRILSRLHMDNLDEEAASVYLEKLLEFKIPFAERTETLDRLIAHYEIANEKRKLKDLSYKEWLYSKNLQWLYETARLSVGLNEFDQAADFYRTILKENHYDMEALSWLADYHEIMGEEKSALKYYEIISKRPEADDYLKLKYVALLFKGGKFSELIEYLRNSEPLFKRQKSRLMYLADSLIASGNLEDAEKTWESVVRRYPNDARAIEGYAYALTELQKYTNIIGLLEKWHEKTNGNHRTHHLLGDAYAAVGRSDDARREYGFALQLIRS